MKFNNPCNLEKKTKKNKYIMKQIWQILEKAPCQRPQCIEAYKATVKNEQTNKKHQ